MTEQSKSTGGLSLIEEYWATIGAGMVAAQTRIESHFATQALTDLDKASFIIDEMIARMSLQKSLAENFANRAVSELADGANEAASYFSKQSLHHAQLYSHFRDTQLSHTFPPFTAADIKLAQHTTSKILSEAGGIAFDVYSYTKNLVDGDSTGAIGALASAFAAGVAVASLPASTTFGLIALFAVGTSLSTDWLVKRLLGTHIENTRTALADFFVDIDVNNLFTSATTLRLYDPLTLDLDGDGIETLSADGSVLFDHNGDGVKQGTGWIAPDDGLLVLDRNGNGLIDNGSELFGDNTTLNNGQSAEHGFAALSDLDSNGDGQFDAEDAQFADVKVWRDQNSDGISQSDELMSLDALNIQSIHLNAVSENTHLGNGNRINARSQFTRTDGSTGDIANLDLQKNGFYREFSDAVEIPDPLKHLPNMQGSGNVRDLREAAHLNAGLAEVLEDYNQATTREQQTALLDPLLIEWAQSSAFELLEHRVSQWNATASSGAQIDYTSGFENQTVNSVADKLQILEVFNDAAFEQNSTLFHSIQSLFKTNGKLVLSSAHQDLLNQAYDQLRQSVYDSLIFQTRLKPHIEAIGLDLVDDTLSLDFSELETRLAQRIVQDPSNGLIDSIDFHRLTDNNLNWAGWEFIGEQLSHATLDTASQAVLDEYNILFVNGEGGPVLGDRSDNRLLGSSGDDILKSGRGNDLLVGGDGNDYLYGGSYGSNTLKGGAGDDTLVVGLYGSKQSGKWIGSTLDGGQGNDTLTGSGHRDTYLFNLGDGQDIITKGGNDILRFGEGITQSEISYSRIGEDLIFTHTNNSDQITVTGWYGESNRRLERVEFADGTIWNQNKLHTPGLSIIGTTEDDVITLTGSYGETLQGLAGHDTLKAGDGDDTVIGDEGNDSLYGNKGQDTLIGGIGDDRLYGGNGNDLLVGGEGNDYLHGGSYGSDLLQGGAGDDTLVVGLYGSKPSGKWIGSTFEGGTGNDTLTGSGHRDTYLFNLGDGQDIITKGGNDILRFGENITESDIRYSRIGEDLIFTHTNNSDQITVTGWYGESNRRLERVEFADGIIWDQDTLHTPGLSLIGTTQDDVITTTGSYGETLQGLAGHDTLKAGDGDDTLIGDGGNDFLYGDKGQDTLVGGMGDDHLYGSRGNDWLIGGEGNDYLSGGNYGSDHLQGGDGDDTLIVGTYGSKQSGRWVGSTLEGGQGNDTLTGSAHQDTYVFNRDDGQDRIVTQGGKDVLELGENIHHEQLWFSQSGNDLNVQVIGGQDQATIVDWYSGSSKQIHRFESGDGYSLSNIQVDLLVQAMAAFVPPDLGEMNLSDDLEVPLIPVIADSWQVMGG